LIDEMKDEIEV